MSALAGIIVPVNFLDNAEIVVAIGNGLRNLVSEFTLVVLHPLFIGGAAIEETGTQPPAYSPSLPLRLQIGHQPLEVRIGLNQP